MKSVHQRRRGRDLRVLHDSSARAPTSLRACLCAARFRGHSKAAPCPSHATSHGGPQRPDAELWHDQPCCADRGAEGEGRRRGDACREASGRRSVCMRELRWLACVGVMPDRFRTQSREGSAQCIFGADHTDWPGGRASVSVVMHAPLVLLSALSSHKSIGLLWTNQTAWRAVLPIHRRESPRSTRWHI